MMTPALQKAVDVITSELLSIAREVIAQQTDKKTSRLADSLSAGVQYGKDSLVISLLMDNYVEYLEMGRKPRSGKMPPIDQLRDWAIERGIDPSNDTLYAISYAIWRDGVAPQPILSLVDERVDKAFDERWAEMLMEAVMKDLVDYFK